MNISTLRIVAWRMLLFGLCSAFLSACSSENIIDAIDGGKGNADSFEPTISANSRYVAFTSLSNNLVSGDTNMTADIFVHDRNSGITERVSIATDGSQANAGSYKPSISADGRYVAFIADASNLVAGDTNNEKDVFVHDRESDSTELVSIDSAGNQGNFDSDQVAISADGRYVAFTSLADNLVLNDTNNEKDVFVHDRDSDTTERISVSSSGSQGDGYHAAISADGRYVAFTADTSHLILDDTNNAADIFVHDRGNGTTERVSIASDGSQGNFGSLFPAISANGRHVAFDSSASNLVPEDSNAAKDVFVHDRETNLTSLVSIAQDGSQGDGDSTIASISGDGSYVVFQSFANTLISNDNNGFSNVFIHHRYVGITELVSVSINGGQANSHSYQPAISADGHYVVFQSQANNIISNDNNASSDIFIRKVN